MSQYLSPAIMTALSALEFLAASRELGVTELARKLGMSKSSVHRVLNTLVHKGYIEKNGTPSRYRLTYRLFLVASAAADRYGLKEVAGPVMEGLAIASGETANLGILEEDRVHNIHRVSGPQPLHLNIDAPGGVKAHATGLGKVLLAGLEPEKLAGRLGTTPLARLTPNTLASRRSLSEELERVRQRGYAVDNEECSLGIRAVAAPIRDSRGTVVAAVSIAGPTQRLTEERIAGLARQVMAAGEEISRRLGYTRDGRRAAISGNSNQGMMIVTTRPAGSPTGSKRLSRASSRRTGRRVEGC